LTYATDTPTVDTIKNEAKAIHGVNSSNLFIVVEKPPTGTVGRPAILTSQKS